MNDSSVIEIVLQALILVAKVAGPLLATSLVVGLLISLIQSVVQVQEMTLVFVPKIIAIFIVLLLALPFAGAAMSGLMTDIAHRIAAY